MELEINSISSSRLFKDYSATRRLSIGNLIGEGGFGSVYQCVRIDGTPDSSLVIKILHDTEDGKKGFETAKKLQDRLNSLNASRLAKREKSLDEVSALLGSPQFCFEGIWKGKAVKGYCMFDLTKMGYVSFDTITDSKDLLLRKEYSNLEVVFKLRFGRSLVAGLRILSELYFVHADINPQNLFINLEKFEVAVIDFDSGAIMDGIGERPTTLGRIMEGEWLAPEILEQIALTKSSKKTVRISLLTDYWSIAVAVHYLLFLRGPYFFLKTLGKEAVLEYLAQYRWYDAGLGHSALDTSKLKQHSNYVEYVAILPQALMERFRKTFNEGFSQPAVRTSSSQWETTLSLILDTKPMIRTFSASENCIVEGQKVHLKWMIDEEFQTFLDGDEVTGTNEFETILDDTTEFLLDSRSLGGASIKRKLTVQVQKYPKIYSFKVDSTDIGEGERVRFNWNAKYHQKLWLNGELIPSNHNSKQVSPVGPTTEYALVAENPIGKAISQTIVVRVHKPPVLHRIWADRSALTSEDPLTVFWDAIHANEVEIICRQIAGNHFLESTVTVAANLGKQVIYLAETTEVICIAKSRYGASKLGGLHIDVVSMPKYQFEFGLVASLPPLDLNVTDVPLFEYLDVFEQEPLSVHTEPQLPPEFDTSLRKQAQKYAYFVLFCISLAAVSGILGYFLAIASQAS